MLQLKKENYRKMNKEKVSIILPIYNKEKYLSQALDSLLSQTYKNFEIICVNDASTDGGLDILENYAQKDSRIRIINLEQNSGAANARNVGMQNASGSFLLFLDADDLFEKTLLSDTVRTAEKNNCDIVIFNYNRFSSRSEQENPPIANFTKLKAKIEKEVFSYKDTPSHIFNLCPPNPFTKLFRSDFVKKTGLKYQSLTSCNDVYFVLCALSDAETICILDKVLVHYRVDSAGNISSTRGSKAKNIVKAAKAVKEYLESRGKYNLLKKSYLKAFKAFLKYEKSKCSESELKNLKSYCKNELKDNWREFKLIFEVPFLKRIFSNIKK